MSTSFPLPTLAASVSMTGITSPSYVDILASLKASFHSIYGSDAYLEPDSQDGQLLAIFAQAIYDCNQATIAAYNAFSPNTAQGAGLSSVVKINHIARAIPSNSQVTLTLVGQAGTIITDGVAGDDAGNRWALPSPITIPFSGSITATATCTEPGAVAAVIGAVNKILTPTAGWQSVTNDAAASPGEPVETDAALRQRQQISVALASKTVLEGLLGTLLGLTGVLYAAVYENDTGTTDANGLPPHSISAVVQGGDATQIAEAIYRKKAPGCATYGTTVVAILDAMGYPRNINFFIPVVKLVKVKVTLAATVDYTSLIGDRIKAEVADAINSMSIGDDVQITRLYLPALLNGALESKAYILNLVEAAFVAGTFGTTNLTIAFNEKAGCQVADVSIVVV